MRRRDFLAILSSSALFAASCSKPDRKIVSAINPVEYSLPGNADYYSSVYCLKNAAYGIEIKTREGRPVKIDGNPSHPVNAGSSSIYMQAALYDLYNPKRISKPLLNGRENDADKCLEAVAESVKNTAHSNKTTAILIDEHCSPSFDALIRQIEANYPGIKFYTFPAVQSGRQASVNRQLFGIDAEFAPDLSKTDYIFSIGSDFLGTDKLSLYHTRNLFANKIGNKQITTVESNLSLTGLKSNKRITIRPDEFGHYVLELIRELHLDSGGLDIPDMNNTLKSIDKREFSGIKEIATSLKSSNSCIICGDYLPETVQYFCMLINYLIGAVGTGKVYDPVHVIPYSADKMQDYEELKEKLSAGEIDTLIFAGINPYMNTGDGMTELLNSVDKSDRFAFTYYRNEASENSAVFIPTTHFCESWGDAVSFDKTFSICQPVVKPLNASSMQVEDILINLMNKMSVPGFAETSSYYDFLEKQWPHRFNSPESKHQALKSGVFKQRIESEDYNISFNSIGLTEMLHKININKNDGLIAAIQKSPTLFDASFSDNGWLRELPGPITKISWADYALINSNTAEANQLSEGDEIELHSDNNSITLPVAVLDEISDNTLILQYGKGDAGQFFGGNYCIPGISISKTGRKTKLPKTQSYIEELPLGLVNSTKPETDIYPGYEYKNHKWAMAIDIDSCTGCNACVIACQAENNIPIVGPENIQKGRDMYWMNTDRYKIKDKNVFLPLMCQHCDNAPCESVCPAHASTHSPEGLNETTYNRCVGTRFCMVNCPYKVRKFNYSDYHRDEKKPFNNIYNPDVTVRMRGIVEKCSFCVQRINEAKYKAKDAGLEKVPDKFFQTACQQACPSKAIIFGDINDPGSEISKAVKHGAFRLLEELNTKPSVYYLKKSDGGGA